MSGSELRLIANLVVAVLSAGYSVRDELPIFVVMFAATLVALVVRRVLAV